MSSTYKEKIGIWDWYEEESVISTNDTIKEYVEKLGKNIVVSAIHQTGGRGRRGNKWQEITGNLYFTYTQEAEVQELSKIVCIVGLSLAKTIKQRYKAGDIKIKWPNDVFLNGKKLSGILLENIKDTLWAIGIGVNVEKAPVLEGMPYQATSLKESGLILDRIELLHYYLQQFLSDMQEYRKNGFDKIRREWLDMAKGYKEKIKIKTEREVKEGFFEDIDDNGYLILKTNKGTEKIIAGDLFI